MRINPSLISPALTALYRAWVRSIRYDDQGGLRETEAALASGRPVLLAIWHAELFALTGYGLCRLYNRVATVVSDSRDGEIIAQVLERIGYGTARGSSTRGGLKAIIALKRHMDQGRIGVITVDGPRGPRHKVKDGAVYLAHKTGALLIPVRSRPSAKYVFERSWDQFELPRPFCRCPVYFGNPLEIVAEKTTPEMLAREGQRLEQALHATLPPE
ncbi:MAG: lysophospholipid acyltransferase family protein [Humidesulfovibrio sp.]|uniref:lysophospholipid acyltransferase family protein n=1 Tax=Humidesulfovibrio sp. TaxID=2910988 RepID=UPI00273646BC|nr:lysophospholipid acyltransferase family protein [Humidesulfovibrio sp.]MDP2847914.1 lysophospholipid acyltransferase family protein [Humidesulfovibrio sp.]